MTFSLVARCKETGMFGLAISSSSPAVAARCSYARAGVGAVASQNVTDPSLGPLTLDLMQQGHSAADAVEQVVNSSAFTDYRQLLAVDTDGRTAIHSGPNSLGIWTQAQAENVASGGNLLANDSVPDRSSLRLDWGLPNRKYQHSLGCLQTTTGRLRAAGTESGSRTILWRTRGRVIFR